jgi:hypothetical protein
MTTSVLSGLLLAADPGSRQLKYRLLTYGEEGATSAGRVRVRAGALTVPDGDIVGNIEHDYTRPVARASSVVDNGQTLEATFTVAPTHTGDDLLAEAAAGLRTGASVEVDNVRIQAGWVEAGALSGVGFVVRPAFPSSQLVAGEHPDVDPIRPEEPAVTDPTDAPDLTAAAGAGDPPPPAPADATPPAPALVPPAFHTAPRTPLTVATVAQLVAAVNQGTRDPSELRAALVDVIPSNDAGGGLLRPAWIGELWSATNVARPLIDAIQSAALPPTGTKVQGWRWVTKPTGANYAGNKQPIPSTAVATEAVEEPLTRWAGGNDVDRIFLDRGDAGFTESYFRMLAADYALDSELTTVTAIEADATAGAAATSVLEVITDATTKLAAIGASLSFVAIAGDLAGSLMQITNLNAPWLMGPGDVSKVFVEPNLAPGTALAGDRRAATFYEDRPPIRVNAVNVAQGGVDLALFGYYASLVNDARAVLKYTVTLAATAGAQSSSKSSKG